MYSDEIGVLLATKNYYIDSETYLKFCETSPQINRLKFDSYSSTFEVWTNDGYYWMFRVYRKEKLDEEN